MLENKLEQGEQVKNAIDASTSLDKVPFGIDEMRAKYVSDPEDRKTIRGLKIEDPNDFYSAYKSMYEGGNKHDIEALNEMLDRKARAHSQNLENIIKDMKSSAEYINPFHMWTDIWKHAQGLPIEAPLGLLALIAGPVVAPYKAVETIISGVKALKEKRMLERVEGAKTVVAERVKAEAEEIERLRAEIAGDMVKPEGVPQDIEEKRKDQVNELGALLHDEWRESRKKEDGTFEPRLKKTKDESWAKEHGVDEIDIANTDYVNLPEDWKGENKISAEVAMNEVYKALENKKELDDTFIESASEAMHIKWLERNGSWAPPEQKLPYAELSEEEKEKDRVIIRKAIEIYKSKE